MPESQRKHVETALDPWWDDYRKKLSAGGSNRVVTFIRSRRPAPGKHGRRAQLFRTLEQQTNADTIGQYTVTFLGEELCLCEHCRKLCDDAWLLETAEDLESWRDGRTHSTGFVKKEINSSLTGEQHSVLVPPEIALGIYVNDSLAGVFPCTTADANFRPEAYLHGLVTGRLAEIGN